MIFRLSLGILAIFWHIISVGDRLRDVERLVSSLSEIKRIYKRDKTGIMRHEYISPKVVLSPYDAFYSKKTALPLKKSAGKICTEFLCAIHPGFPFLLPVKKLQKKLLTIFFMLRKRAASLRDLRYGN
jgi:arginine/lysine/ornithine decarboxylase